MWRPKSLAWKRWSHRSKRSVIVYTPEEVAAILKVTTKTVYNLIHRKELPASRVGSLFRITEDQLSRYLESTEEHIMEQP